MSEIFLIILCVILSIVALSFLYHMPRDFLNRFEKECQKSIKKRDEEYEKEQELNRAMKKILFK